jgi:hypothetical protein
VTTTASTTFITNGLTLALNVKAEAEGTFDANGVLVARKVELKRDNSVRVVATIDSIDLAANTLRMRIGGLVTVTVSAATQLEDKSSAQTRPFRLADLRAGDYLEVRGFENPNGDALIAMLIEREDPDNDVELRGTARNVADPNVSILGVNNALGAGIQFRDTNDSPITRADFFQRAPNRIVQLSGRVSGGIPVWDEAELED